MSKSTILSEYTDITYNSETKMLLINGYDYYGRKTEDDMALGIFLKKLGISLEDCAIALSDNNNVLHVCAVCGRTKDYNLELHPLCSHCEPTFIKEE